MAVHSIEFLREAFTGELEKLHFGDQPPELYAPIDYMLEMGGKRIRPALVLAACELFGKDYRIAMPAALAVEIFHNFTLVHDDIMDEAPLRRGKETVYQKWNTPIAILAGDTMLSWAYEMLARLDEPVLKPAIKLFNRTSIEVCEGQQYDMNFESKANVSIEEYIHMIRLKTAVLLGGSLKMGALVAKASEEQQQKVYHFGVSIGIAFQLKDDLLDVYGDKNLFGKQESGDIVTNKKTYLYLRALEKSGRADKEILQDLYSRTLDENEEKIRAVKDIFDRNRIREETEDLMKKYYQDAISDLDEIKVDEALKVPLKSIANQIIERNY